MDGTEGPQAQGDLGRWRAKLFVAMLLVGALLFPGLQLVLPGMLAGRWPGALTTTALLVVPVVQAAAVAGTLSRLAVRRTLHVVAADRDLIRDAWPALEQRALRTGWRRLEGQVDTLRPTLWLNRDLPWLVRRQVGPGEVVEGPEFLLRVLSRRLRRGRRHRAAVPA